MTLQVRVSGRPLREVGPHTVPLIESLADGGTGMASWTMRPEFGRVRWGFLEGARADVFESGYRVWTGTVESIDRQDGGVVCRGRWADGNYIPALSTAGEVTATVATAVTGAQALGWGVSQNGITGTITGDVDEPMMITEYLELLANQSGHRIGVDGRPGSRIVKRADPTAPEFVVTSRDIEISGTDRGRVNALMGRYVDSAGVRRTAVRPAVLPSPISAETIDLSARRKVLTKTQAEAILDAILVKMSMRPRWTNRIEVPLSAIKRVGGGRLTSPVNIRGGAMVRLPLLSTAHQDQVGAMSLDAVLGRVVFGGGSDLVQLEPVEATVLTLADAFEEVMKA